MGSFVPRRPSILARIVLAAILVGVPSAAVAQGGESPVPSGPEWQSARTADTPTLGRAGVTAWRDGYAATSVRHDAGDERIAPPSVWLSRDGIAWQASPAPFGRLDVELVAFDGGLLAVGVDGPSLAVWRSLDGRTWQRVPDAGSLRAPGMTPGDSSQLRVLGTAVSDGRVMVSTSVTPAAAEGSDGVVFTSRDGVRWWSWTTGLDGDAPVAFPVPARHGFVGLVQDFGDPEGCITDRYHVVRSNTGRRWRPVDGAPICLSVRDVAYDARHDATLVVGLSGDDEAIVPVILRSVELESWDQVYQGFPTMDGMPVTWVPDAIAARPDAIVAVGGLETHPPSREGQDQLWSLSSADGIDWVPSVGWPAMLDAIGPWDVAVSGDRVVTVSAAAPPAALWTRLSWAAPGEATCERVPATIVGSSGPDVLSGTRGDDVIAAGAGDDTIDGLDGNDRICGGDGDDLLRGGEGRDRILGDKGDDTLRGGQRRDQLSGGPGWDRLAGEGGDDNLSGGHGQNVVDGGPGRDMCVAISTSSDGIRCEGPGG